MNLEVICFKMNLKVISLNEFRSNLFLNEFRSNIFKMNFDQFQNEISTWSAFKAPPTTR
jgi:hypothetical protein